MQQQYSMQGCIVDLQRYRATFGETNFIKQVKAPIFLEEVLAIGIMQELQSNLEDKGNHNILKDGFSSRTDPSFLQVFLSLNLVCRWHHETWISIILKFGFLNNKKLLWNKKHFSLFHMCCLLDMQNKLVEM